MTQWLLTLVVLYFLVGLLSKLFRSSINSKYGKRFSSSDAFLFYLLVLVSAVMRANGKVLRSELNYVKQFFVQHFGVQKTRESLRILRDLLQQNLPLEEACYRVSGLDEFSKLQLLTFLFAIAHADGVIDEKELSILQRVCQLIGLTSADFTATRALFLKNTNWAYDVLEITPTATDEEVKKAFRNMAIKHHPDKVAHQGESVQKVAVEKMKQINDAYNTIRKQRGIS